MLIPSVHRLVRVFAAACVAALLLIPALIASESEIARMVEGVGAVLGRLN